MYYNKLEARNGAYFKADLYPKLSCLTNGLNKELFNDKNRSSGTCY